MINKTMFLLAGMALVLFGFKTMIIGGHQVYGYPTQYGALKMPVSLFFMICGVVLIVFSFWKRKDNRG
ncbi:MAG: hypothetical protein HQL08_11370 [Nitrospirae bacterium]|nr:hypothetical protein [Nitrospirota bacterium]